MRIEDIKIELNTKKIDENNWEINKWRKEYPVDYFKMAAMLLNPDEAILRDEVFKALYKIIRLYIPDTVYKYYSLDVSEKRDEENLDTLYKGKVYMSEIKGFNDPFDGRAFFYNPKELENIERLKHCGGRLIDDFSEFVRVSCFTGNGVQSMPMWAHYANNHKGLCLKYKVNNKKAIRNVLYEPKPIDITKLFNWFIERAYIVENMVHKSNDITEIELQRNMYATILQDIYTIKHNSWECENEYRIILPKGDFANKLNGENVYSSDYGLQLTEVYCGINCSEDNLKKITSICKSLNVTCTQCKRNMKEFTVFE